MSVFGTDYETPDGTCLRDYIHVSDLVAAHLDALTYLRQGGASAVMNCGLRPRLFGAGGDRGGEIHLRRDFNVTYSPRRAGDPAAVVAKADKIRATVGLGRRSCDDLPTIVRTALEWERGWIAAATDAGGATSA